MLRDGFHQHAVHGGVAPYRPNSLDGGCPFVAGDAEGAFVDMPVVVAQSSKVRESPVSFEDHFSQARLFWSSMSGPEREHIVRAYTFELGKCFEQAIRERQLQALAEIDSVLCEQVALGLGLPAPAPNRPLGAPAPSPALSQVGRQWPTDGRVVGIVVDPNKPLDDVGTARRALLAAGIQPVVIAPSGGQLPDGTPIQRSFLTARSVEFDAILLAGAPPTASDATPLRDEKAGEPALGGLDPRVALLVLEAFRHAKALGGWGQGGEALEALVGAAPGVITDPDASVVTDQVRTLMRSHRVWERFPVSAPLA